MSLAWAASGFAVLALIWLATAALIPKRSREREETIESLRGKYRDRLPPSSSYLNLRERDEHESGGF